MLAVEEQVVCIHTCHLFLWMGISLSFSMSLVLSQKRLIEGLKAYHRTVIGGATGLLLLFAAWWIWMHRPPLGCASLPEYGSVDKISVYVARVADQPGVVCARVYNGTDEEIGYGGGSFSLQESWLWVVWLPHFNVKDVLQNFLSGSLGIAFTADLIIISPGGKAEGHYLPSSAWSRHPAPPGRYRVCFSYRTRWSSDEQRVCSAPFWLP